MSQKTINVSTLKAMINKEYDRSDRLYQTYASAKNGRNADYYTARMSALIDISAQIEHETGVTIFDDNEEQCNDTLTSSSPVPKSQNRPAKNFTTASATL